MILASERRYADSHARVEATHAEADGIDCGASRRFEGLVLSGDCDAEASGNDGGAACAGPADSRP